MKGEHMKGLNPNSLQYKCIEYIKKNKIFHYWDFRKVPTNSKGESVLFIC